MNQTHAVTRLPLPSLSEYRFYIDLKTSSFIFVFKAADLPPEGWPLVEVEATDLMNYLNEEFDNGL